jgi:hypothetical protein
MHTAQWWDFGSNQYCILHLEMHRVSASVSCKFTVFVLFSKPTKISSIECGRMHGTGMLTSGLFGIFDKIMQPCSPPTISLGFVQWTRSVVG